MPVFKPLVNSPLAHLVNSSLAAVMLLCPLVVVLRTAATGREARAADVVATFALLTDRTAGGVIADGPVGILTLPPAPTVDQAEPPTGGLGAVGLLARSA